jgi:tetratricopeptide (TPR) repeat protein
LGLITFVLYFPALWHDFLAYDDQQYVTENLHVQSGLTRQSLVWAFGNHAGNWHPLAWISHELDCQIFGLRAWGHQLTSMLLHAANTMLLFVLLRRLTGAVWRSAAVAALFGCHPLHVESVAWVAERKDVLSAFFWMVTLLAYRRYVCARQEYPVFSVQSSDCRKREAVGWYGLTLLLFVLGLMSKPMIVTLPFVMLLLDFWPLDRFRLKTGHWPLNTFARLVMEKLPFFSLVAASCWLTVRAQQEAIVSTKGLPVLARVVHAIAAYGHYLGATFVPRNLAIMYPYEARLPAAQVVLSALVLAAFSIVAIRFARSRPWLTVGWLWFLGTLVPVIGLVQVGDQAWADRYTYLPLIGLFIAVAWESATWIWRLFFQASSGVSSPRLKRGEGQGAGSAQLSLAPRLALSLGSVTVGAALLTATSLQLSYWKNTRTVFEHAARATQQNYMAVTLLGSLLAKDGKLDEAKANYQQALAWEPNFAEAHFFLGHALDQQGKVDDAIQEYQRALRYKPTQAPAHIYLGIALAKQKKFDQAANHYRAALKLNPDSAVAHNDLAKVLHTEGKLDEAIEHYRAALKSDPSLAEAHNNLGILLLQRSQPAQGAAELREALRLNPENKETQYNLALALNAQQKWPEAAALFGKTVGAQTTDPNAHYQFATALFHEGNTKEALSEYASALLIQPDFPDALDRISWILATSGDAQFRNGTEALRMSEKACELTRHKDPEKLKTLAAAYAEVGRFDEAVRAAQKAGDLAAASGRKELVELCQRMTMGFSVHKPWR